MTTTQPASLIVCPKCGSADRLESVETTLVHYPATFRDNGTARPEIEYTGGQSRTFDESSEATGRIWCRDCDAEFQVSAPSETSPAPAGRANGVAALALLATISRLSLSNGKTHDDDGIAFDRIITQAREILATDTPPALDPTTGEPTNAERAMRVARALTATLGWAEVQSDGNKVDEFDEYTIAAMLTDIRHYCDEYKIDFNHANRISQEHHAAEVV